MNHRSKARSSPSRRGMAPLALSLCALVCGTISAPAGEPKHTFTLGQDDFLLDEKPFQIRSGEIHPERIPKEYWRHRLQMVKAGGLNTVATYIFWNAHETEEGKFDFSTGNLATAEFLKMAQEEGLFVILRPGPYCCGEWDLGGIPLYLLANPDAKLRSFEDKKYLAAVERYFTEFNKIIQPALITRGGPIIMVQIENEFGSFGVDRPYLTWLRDLWVKLGVDVPFCTSDGPAPRMLTNGTVPGAAVGLDSGSTLKHWELARKHNPGVPVFSGESYPGWLTHWGDAKFAGTSKERVVKHLDFLLTNHKSFNWYVMHGGTNFGFTAGANGGANNAYQADITSYDYDAPINEQGRATPKYDLLRKRMQEAFPDEKFPNVPEPIPAMEIAPIEMKPWTTIWNNLPAKPILSKEPKAFEYLGQFHQGMMLYRTKLADFKPGLLDFGDSGVRDFALVYLNGDLLGTLDRSKKESSIEIPQSSESEPVLDILVEAMGHINFGPYMTADRKGIIGPVTFDGAALENWEIHPLPLDAEFMAGLKTGDASNKTCPFFRGSFQLDTVADTYLDMSTYGKGVVWVNGHNLGRFWNIGPQQRLFCPAPFLKKGDNEIIVLDLLKETPEPIRGVTTLR